MTRQERATQGGGGERASLYDEITGRIIAELEEGQAVRPWVRERGL